MSASGGEADMAFCGANVCFEPKRPVQAYCRSGIDLAKVHNAVAANNKTRLNFDLII
jgi:hypothetical protein